MKRMTALITAILLMVSIAMQAQDCFKYFPQKEGTVMKTKHYDKKDKETGESVITILQKASSGGRQQIDVKFESTSPNTDSAFVGEYAYICEDGKVYVEMKSYLGNQLAAYKGMDIEIDGDNIEMPTNPEAGQELGGGNVIATVKNQGIPMMKISLDISNRKVEKKETLKTPAGTFDCFKITQDTESKIGFIKVKGSSAEWFAEGIGLVRSESYDKRGKLVSYSVLHEITK